MAIVGYVAVIWASLVVYTAVHELGHALAASAVGYRVTVLELGRGPVLAVPKSQPPRVELRGLLVGGRCRAIITRRGRSRYVVFVLGGSLATAALVLVALLVSPHAVRVFWVALLLVVLVTDLLPLTRSSKAGVTRTDGRQLWDVALGRADEGIEWSARLHELAPTPTGFATADTPDPVLALARQLEADSGLRPPTPLLYRIGATLLGWERYVEARRIFDSVLERPDLHPRMRYAALLAIATISEETGAFSDARFICEKLRDLPPVSDGRFAALSTLAEVARQTGDLIEAGHLLSKAKESHPLDKAHRASVELLLGVLAIDNGALDEAEYRLVHTVKIGGKAQGRGLAEVLRAVIRVERSNPDEARRLLQAARPHIGWARCVVPGHWELTMGRALRGTGDLEAAEVALQNARAYFTEGGMRPALARLGWESARLAADRGHTSEAASLYRATTEEYEAMGCRREPPLLQAELEQLGSA